MIDLGRFNVIGMRVSAVDYDAAAGRVMEAAASGKPLALSAAASHAIMTGHSDPEQRYRLNRMDELVPDGQPVRHALRILHGIRLPSVVRGSNLTFEVCRRAAAEGLPVYFYGSTPETLAPMEANLKRALPGLVVAGAEPSRFRPLSPEERDEVATRIIDSGARIVFVGLGCPRQETWAYEMRDRLSMPLLAVGAAFDFHAGTIAQAPLWMQRNSLEWLYRLGREPRRLYKRYLGLGPKFIGLVLAQKLGIRRFEELGREPERELRFG